MQKQLSKFWRATIEFDMLAKNDKILVGLSGGKDSTFLLNALAIAKKILPFDISVAAFTLDPMFSDDFATDSLQSLCDKLQVDFYTEKVDINSIVAQKKYKSPCFSCSYFRRAATNRIAKENGFNKIALGHHHDDAVETFLLNLLTSGQVKTFLPVTYLSNTDLTVIRPLVYYREQEIIAINKTAGWQTLKSPCPYNGCTKRQEVKDFIGVINDKVDPLSYEHLAAAMRASSTTELWPTELTREELLVKHKTFWQAKKTASK